MNRSGCRQRRAAAPASINKRGGRRTQVAEELYQHGFLSYPRTETDKFSVEMDLPELITFQFNSPDWGLCGRRN